MKADKSDIKNQTKAIEYDFGITPQIYLQEDNGKVRQVCPDQTLTSSVRFIIHDAGHDGQQRLWNSFMRLPANDALYKDHYDVKAGHWPENDHECVVILTQDGQIV